MNLGYRVLEALIMSAGAAVVLVISDRLTAPLSIPALTTTLGGLAGLWLARGHRLQRTLIGSVAGLAVGVGLHLWSHYSEGRMRPEEGLPYHLVVDAGTASLVAGVALGTVYLAQQWFRPRSEILENPMNPSVDKLLAEDKFKLDAHLRDHNSPKKCPPALVPN